MTDQKRKSGHEHVEGQPTKKSKQWRTPKKNQPVREGRTIEPGDAGIWATCNLGKEGKATIELRDLFEEYAVKIYGEDCLTAQTNLPKGTSLEGDDGKEIGNNDLDTEGRTGNEDGDDDHADGGVSLSSPVDDIEAEIAKEVKSIKKTPTGSSASTGKSDFVPLFRAIRIEVQCVLFFKTRPPVEPVSFVRAICQDFADGKAARRSRWVKRLTPMTLMGKATIGGLEDVGRQVLGDVFGKEQGLKVRGSGSLILFPCSCEVIFLVTTHHMMWLQNHLI